MKLLLAEVRSMAHRAILRFGYTEAETRIIEEVLLYAQLRDSTQGLVKLVGTGIPKHVEAGEIRVEKDTPLSALLNGNRCMGMLVLDRAMKLAVTKAKERGFGIVGTYGTDTSTGAIGYWARRVANAGLLGFIFTSPLKVVAPHGSSEPIFGTNPLSIGIPSADKPLVFDMATSAMAFYGLLEAKTAGRPISPDIAYDREGNATTDPSEAMKGALRTFGGHKGSGLALMIEILSGVLVGAVPSGTWGNLIFAIAPSLLADPETFRENVSDLMARIHGARKLPGVERILLPGERGDRLAQERLKTGEIEIEDNLLAAFRKAAGSGE